MIAISDHSTDKSDKIAIKYNCKFKRLKKNHGSGYTRNVGSKLAKGKILLFVDSDVIIKKNALNIINNHFKKKENHLAQEYIIIKLTMKKFQLNISKVINAIIYFLKIKNL